MKCMQTNRTHLDIGHNANSPNEVKDFLHRFENNVMTAADTYMPVTCMCARRGLCLDTLLATFGLCCREPHSLVLSWAVL